MADDDKRTVDGVPVKPGDHVWFWRGWGNPSLRKLDARWDLGFHWASSTSGEIYSTERAALEAAVVDQRKDLKKLESKVRATRKAIERLDARLRALPPGEPGGGS